MSTLEFGRKYLFDPLGIQVKKWSMDPMDIYIGGSELYITPRDMAKINGKTYKCMKNSLGLNSFRITFKGDACTVKIDKAEYRFQVGKGTYRLSNLEGPVTYFSERPTLPVNKNGPDQYQIAFRGQWLDGHTFLMEWMNYLGEPVKFITQLSFDGNEAEIKTTFLPLEWGGVHYIYASQ